ncbi:uncharacterized protein LOC109418299 [Aedes albopictus]|uniref:CHK kinase-like domain-containing protein n=1 Tax=Aedes albopictus TaxID=7160 RepID=A0ABM1YGH4_AEDAL|nr:uncharacterized protein LOC109418299 [Aedes albopictus]XP_029719901.1 uncharacterized protein LOC109418299 [Aedes albopictus]XP_029719909.1 uncharacterized protein LOC109418299 [Aedes albopictus]
MTESSKESQAAQLPEFVRQSAIRAAVNLGFTPDKFHVRFEAGSNCDGLVGEIHRVTITEGDRQEDLFCKIPPLSAARREEFNSMTLFEREIFLYSTVLPAMFEFQRDKQVRETEGFFNVPKCYLTLFDADSEESVILMENLSNKGYRMGKKVEPVDLDHARLVMTNLGRLHGLSLALKDQQPDLFEKFKLSDVLLPAVKHSEQLVAMFNAALENAISLLGPEQQVERTRMEALREDHIQTLEECLDGSRAEPYAVLNHGDCWINNLLYGYKDGKPTELALIDWQLARYVSPALDVLYFLFCCTDDTFREKHFDEMLEIYHSSLTTFLEQVGSDPQELFPFTALQTQLKSFGKFAVIMAAFDVPILCTDPAEMPDLNGGDLAEGFAASPEAQLRYAGRMGGIIRDAVRYGYL